MMLSNTVAKVMDVLWWWHQEIVIIPKWNTLLTYRMSSLLELQIDVE